MPKRIRRFHISAEMFVSLFKQGSHGGFDVIEDYFPEDSRIAAISLNRQCQVIEVVLTSSYFDEVSPGDEIPIINPTLATTKVF